MAKNTSIKQDAIVEAALRRFSHFGIGKTTLSEIAHDLKISKSALFYYFEDKKSLTVAVFEKLLIDLLTRFTKELETATSAREGFMIYLHARQDAFTENMQLMIEAQSIRIHETSPQIKQILVDAEQKLYPLLERLIKKDIEKGILRPADSNRVTTLIIETIDAYEYYWERHHIIPSKEEIQKLEKKLQEVVHLFFDGLITEKNISVSPHPTTPFQKSKTEP